MSIKILPLIKKLTGLVSFIGKICSNIIKFIRVPVILVVLFSVVSVYLFLPTPWAKQKFWLWGYKDDQNLIFEKKVNFESPLQIFASSVGFPSVLKFYNFYFKIKPQNNELDDILKFNVLLRKDKPFYEYVYSSFDTVGIKIKSGDDDITDTFVLNSGDELVISGISISTPVSFASWIMCTAQHDQKCPDNFQEEAEKMANIFARPNLSSWFANVILIFALWIVVINNIGDIINKSRKKLKIYAKSKRINK